MHKHKDLLVKCKKFLEALLNEFDKKYKGKLPASHAIVIKENETIPDYHSFLATNWRIIESLPGFKKLKEEFDKFELTDHQIKSYTIKLIADYLKLSQDSLTLKESEFIKVYEEFEKYLFTDELEYLCIAGICGLEYNGKINFDINQKLKLYICDIENILKEFATHLNRLSEIGRIGEFWSAVEARECGYMSAGYYAICIAKFPKPKGRNLSLDEIDIPSRQDQIFVKRIFDSFITALRLLKRGNVYLTTLYCIPLSGWTTRSFIFHSSPIPSFLVTKIEQYALSNNDLCDLKNIFYFIKNYDNLDSRLQKAIRRFNSAYEKSNPEDRFIDYVIIWDSLLYPEGRGEARSKIAERMAILLEKDYDKRKEILRRIKKLYDERSAVVHENKSISWELVLEAEDYTRRLLRKLLDLCPKYGSCKKICEKIDNEILRSIDV